jgi:RNA recognition motif-containing protein
MNIYVGNLDYKIRENDIRAAFEEHGEVSSVKIITDRDTGRSKGFAFVEMPNDSQGHNAIEKMNGTELGKRNLVVNEARPRENNGGGGYNNRNNDRYNDMD